MIGRPRIGRRTPTVSLVFTMREVAGLAAGHMTHGMRAYFTDARRALAAAMKQATAIATQQRRRERTSALRGTTSSVRRVRQ